MSVVTIKRIWPLPKIVLCWQFGKCEPDEYLKIAKNGALDYRFELGGKTITIWIERE